MLELLGSTWWGRGVYLLLISMLPVIELRGGIPAGAALDVPWLECYLICVVGNILPVPFLIWLTRPIFNWLRRGICRPLVEKLEKTARRKSAHIAKYKRFGLLLFVAVPLPGTGAWSGALIASAMNMRIRDALFCIFAGVLIAGAIMTAVAYGMAAIF